MSIIKVLTTKSDGSGDFFDEREGEIYKGFGLLTSWDGKIKFHNSKNETLATVVHIKSGLILAGFSWNNGQIEKAVKKRIRECKNIINPNMSYREIENILTNIYG